MSREVVARSRCAPVVEVQRRQPEGHSPVDLGALVVKEALHRAPAWRARTSATWCSTTW